MVRMRDVADAVGVSTSTVSNAFNRPDQLSAELRDRILERAANMGYSGPSPTARALRKGSANSFGVVLTGSLSSAFSDAFTTRWLSGFADAMAAEQANIVLMPVSPSERAAEEALARTVVDGLAVVWWYHPIIGAAVSRGLPVVAPSGGDAVVRIDDHAAGRAVGAHVRSLGHTDVWVLVGPGLTHPPSPVVLTMDEYRQLHRPFQPWNRLVGVLEGLGRGSVRILQATSLDRVAGQQAAALALDRRRRPSAIVALTDNLALGVLDALHARGLAAGRHLTVTGFDDVPEAHRLGLTTVRQPAYEQGHEAAKLLVDPTRQPRQVELPHQLIVRRSSAPLNPKDT